MRWDYLLGNGKASLSLSLPLISLSVSYTCTATMKTLRLPFILSLHMIICIEMGKNVYCDHILKKYRLDEGACSFFRLHHGGRDTYMWKWRKVIEQDWFEGGKDWMHGGLSFCRMCRVAAQGWWRSRDGVITLLCLSLRTRPTLNLKKKKLTTSTRHCVCNCKESSFFLTIPLNTI